MVRLFEDVVVAVPDVGDTDNQLPPVVVAAVAMKFRLPELAVTLTCVLVVVVAPAGADNETTPGGLTLSVGVVMVSVTTSLTGSQGAPPVHDSITDPE